MNTIEEFFKNRALPEVVKEKLRINGNYDDYLNTIVNEKVFREHKIKIDNPLNKSIKNTSDLIKKLLPVIYFELSGLKKLNDTNGFNQGVNHPVNIRGVISNGEILGNIRLFEIKFRFDYLENVNNYKKKKKKKKKN